MAKGTCCSLGFRNTFTAERLIHSQWCSPHRETWALENTSLGKLLWCQYSISRKAESPQRPQVHSRPGVDLDLEPLWPVLCPPNSLLLFTSHNSQSPCSLSDMLAYSCFLGFLYPWVPNSGGQLCGWPRRSLCLSPRRYVSVSLREEKLLKKCHPSDARPSK